MTTLALIDWVGSLLIMAILIGVWFVHFRARDRRVWRCVRYQGGGAINTPRPMTLDEATHWLGRNNDEACHVDTDHGFIFYRPRG
jgi:hypothetical protein